MGDTCCTIQQKASEKKSFLCTRCKNKGKSIEAKTLYYMVKGKFQKLVIPFVRLRTKGRGGSGDDARSAWPLRLGLHTCYNGEDKGTPTRKGEQIPKTSPQFRLGAATRPHEVGIASNRGSAMPR